VIEFKKRMLTQSVLSILLVCPVIVLLSTDQVNAETLKKPKTTPPASKAKAEQPVTALGEMVVSDKRQPFVDNWLTRDNSTIPVQERTQLGLLTKSAPIAGSIIDQEELRKVKYVDILRDQLNRVPGVSMVRNMRIPDGGKSYTGNLVDGMMVSSLQNQAFTFMDQFNPADVDRFEVIRGIGSVLNPSNFIAGSFNVYTKTPTKNDEYSLSQEFGTYDYFRTQGATSGTIKNTPINDIGYTASFNAMEYDPWKDRTRTTRYSASGKLVFHPDELSNLTLKLDHYNMYMQNPGTLTRQQFDSNWRQANPSMLNLYQDFEYLTGGASYKRQIGQGGELEVSFVRREQNGTDANPGGGSGASSTTQNFIDYSTNNAHVVYRQDFDFVKSRFYVGNDVMNSYQYTQTWNRPANGFTPTTLASSVMFNETQVAPFAQYEFSPLHGVFKDGFLSSLDNLRFTYGMRYEDFQQRYQPATFTNKGSTIATGRTHYDKIIKKGGISYEFQKDHILWFSMGDGWLVPNSGNIGIGSTYTNYGITPETSMNKQLGLRGFFREANLTYDITAYQTHIHNYIASVLCSDNPSACPGWTPKVAGATTASVSGNPGAVMARGLETSLAYQPHDMVKFSVAHTWAQNTWDQYIAGATKLYGVGQVNMPRHHVNARVTLYPVQNLSVELEADHISKYNTNIQNTDSYQRPMLFNLRSQYQWKNWTLSLQAINLLNTKYASRVTANNLNVQSYGTLAGIGDGPFTFRAGIEYKF
jgi:iron complex outermembrane receptor protein